MGKDTTVKELNPRVEAQRVEAAARKAEMERKYERARTTPIRGPIPELRKGMQAYVAGEDTTPPDGKPRRPGEVFLVKDDVEPSVTWCPLEEHVSQKKQES